MKRRQFLQQSSLLSAGFIGFPALSPLSVSDFMDHLASSMIEIRNGVGYFIGRGGTIGWLISNEGIVTVDAQFPDSAANYISLAKDKIEAPFSALINTHHHYDHSSGNIAFKGLAEKVIGHQNALANQQSVAKSRGNMDSQWLIDTPFENQMELTVGDQKIKAYYFGPAHTNGDIVVHFENSNIAHVGDLVFNRRFPYIDKSAGASIENWIQVLAKIRGSFDQDTRYIFGHSDNGYDILGTSEDILAFQNYLTLMLEFVAKNKRQGKSLVDLKAEVTSIPGAEEWKGSGIERSLDAAFIELEE
jgi:cyclase